MYTLQPVERLVNLLDPENNLLLNMSLEEALSCVASGDVSRIRAINGQFAIVHKEGVRIRMARSLGRPMRYFLAKRAEGPCLVVAERIDQIHAFLVSENLHGQFHPSYTRMVPAHYLVELQLVGCPDPNPALTRYFTPERNRWSADLDEIGRMYVGALLEQIRLWLARIDSREPIGLLFSGGIDSGLLFVLIHHALLSSGQSPARLKAFTLTVDGASADATQAFEFLRHVDLGMFLETVDVPEQHLNYREAVRVLEDYKPLDVQSGTMAFVLCRAIRARYPEWRYLVDGDGGDENLKDYPIEEDAELTIRSVLNNLLLYQEGWGVSAVKHSLTYSGGQSRGHVRTYAPARFFGFEGFSPYTLASVIEVAEGIPFVELTDWNSDKLYALKGELAVRGVHAVTGLSMPAFPKRRFQRGVVAQQQFTRIFPSQEADYRREFAQLYE